MQLILAMVQSVDAGLACEQLVRAGFRVTRIGSRGSFLNLGNETLLVGVEDAETQRAMDSIRASCRTRRQFVSTAAASVDSMPVHSAVEVEVGGATVFVLPVERFAQLEGGGPPLAADLERPPDANMGAAAMKLIIAVVQRDLLERVTGGLLRGGYRVTRIDTVGGFFRRGNGTLLIGVEAGKVEDVLRRIQEGSRPKAAPTATEKGTPMYSATVFVLDAPTFLRI